MYWTTLLLMISNGPLPSFTEVKATNVNKWLGEDEYPLRAARLEKSGWTQADIFVAADGKPEACYVVVSSGSEDLDGQSCAAAIRRGKFKPATDETGKQISGMYRFTTIWLKADRAAPKLPADITLTVSQLPNEHRSARVELKYLVDETGQIIKCAVLESSGSPQLDSTACRAMSGRFTFAPARDKAGKAWPVARTQSVAFEVSR